MKKRLILVLGMFVLTPLIGSVFRQLYPNHQVQIDQRTFERIEYGMSLDDVERTIGAPPGDYTTKTITWDLMLSADKYWKSDSVCLGLWFDSNGKLYAKEITGPLSFGQPSFFDRLKMWLGRLMKN